MTDKPQTLAEQALKLARLQERMDAIGNQKQNHKPIIDCLRDCAAALADAAATTPVVGADPTPPTALSCPPKDGRMLCLLVDYSDGDHPLEDAKQAWTIGYNTLADTGDDEWLIAGWSWEQDCYTDGRGTVIGWLPFPCDHTHARG